MSVNAQLGFPLKVLEELNESIERDSPTPSSSGSVTPTGTSTKTPFFESTYHHIRQQNRLRPNRLEAASDVASNAIDIKLPEHVERVLENLTVSPKESDSGISTPVSLRTCGGVIVHEIIEPTSPSIFYSADMHPLSSCEDVNFKFNGTTQLKSFRPQHYHGGGGSGRSTGSGGGVANTMTTAEAATVDHASNSIVKMGRS